MKTLPGRRLGSPPGSEARTRKRSRKLTVEQEEEVRRLIADRTPHP